MMTRAELPFLVFGRLAKPFHLAVVLATLTIADVNLRQNSTSFSTTIWGDIVGAVAAVAVLLLVAGWWFRKDRWADEGLLLATGVWTARATAYWLEGLGWLGVMLSTAWVVGTFGAWLLESYDHRWRHERGLISERRAS